ncbi:MAG: hypothetical protein Q8P24_11155 [Desulfobacterales bacterium]|nr:hypothetical protein [Desulfobacterales bacterium]
MSVHYFKELKTWFCQYRIPGESKKRREYFGPGDAGRLKAQARDREIAATKQAAVKKHQRSPLFVDLSKLYVESKVASISHAGMDNLLWKLNGVICPKIGHIPAAQISPDLMMIGL